jgi:hypothetical protein
VATRNPADGKALCSFCCRATEGAFILMVPFGSVFCEVCKTHQLQPVGRTDCFRQRHPVADVTPNESRNLLNKTIGLAGSPAIPVISSRCLSVFFKAGARPCLNPFRGQSFFCLFQSTKTHARKTAPECLQYPHARETLSPDIE